MFLSSWTPKIGSGRSNCIFKGASPSPPRAWGGPLRTAKSGSSPKTAPKRFPKSTLGGVVRASWGLLEASGGLSGGLRGVLGACFFGDQFWDRFLIPKGEPKGAKKAPQRHPKWSQKGTRSESKSKPIFKSEKNAH